MTQSRFTLLRSANDGKNNGSIHERINESKEIIGKNKSVEKKPLSQRIKDEALHYWHGSKLLVAEIKISFKLMWKMRKGESLTRREYRQLIRTSGDLFRLIPFSVFVIVPFLELLLPVALKLFPNMLPSTFEDQHKKEEERKKQLKVKIEMASFLQDIVKTMAVDKNSEKSRAAQDFSELFRKCRVTGEPVATEDLIKVSKQFEDQMTLENLSRPQLVSMCRYMNIKAYGTDNFLRYLIRTRMQKLKADDKMIMKEGVENLNIPELQSACQARGIKFLGASPVRMRNELQQWLDLHLKHEIPQSLLILSRAFMIDGEQNDPSEALRAAISSLPDSVVNEVELNASKVAGEENLSPKQKLEVIEQQEEMIEDEAIQEEKEIEAKLKEEKAEHVSTEKEELTEKQKEQLKEAIIILSSESTFESEKDKIKELKLERQDLKSVNFGKASVRLNERLEKMISQIENELKKYDNEIGNRLNLIKTNDLGQISVDQLELALRMMRDHPDEAKIKEIVSKLDKDGDGFVFLNEIVQYPKPEGHGKVESESPKENK
ncbi:LETM1-domain-containing protein [Rozella allomycis CSF55]|uniref:Mitochondrial proton/calcium exchanger protein n=1 Tax=Rozella allomycis (strain CSF55) TaxID=988480 RepID=A0A4P9YM97_ROZAC|nr:LETM1-domain-containing protein [Rozella allomycis CSF55]